MTGIRPISLEIETSTQSIVKKCISDKWMKIYCTVYKLAKVLVVYHSQNSDDNLCRKIKKQ